MSDVQTSSGASGFAERGTANWGDAAVAGFQVVPDVLLINQARLRLTATDMVVLLNVCSYWWSRDQLPFPRAKIIAARMGLDVRSVQRSLRNLLKRGLVMRQRVTRLDGAVVRALRLDPLIEKLDLYTRADPVLSARVEQYRKFKGIQAKGNKERTADTLT